MKMVVTVVAVAAAVEWAAVEERSDSAGSLTTAYGDVMV